MSRFFSSKYDTLSAYVPGEQPRDKKYIKLNTNESPYPPSERVLRAAREAAENLQLYSDPDCTVLINEMSKVFGVPRDKIIMSNGSDEVLNFAFMAFCDESHPIVFPDITYGFYPVFARLNGIPYREIPLKDDFSIDYKDYLSIGANVVFANPNAPTGIALPICEIEEIVRSNPNNVVIIDEAYVDFGAESAINLTEKYDNLLVVGTFSKSRSLAGGRLGFGIGSPELIRDLNTIRYSTNPYNVNRMTMAVGVATLADNAYYMDNCKKIIETREYTKSRLAELGFSVIPSSSNFLFAKSDSMNAEDVYLRLKDEGVLIRYFSKERIKDYVRITIGTREEMDGMLSALKKILQRDKK